MNNSRPEDVVLGTCASCTLLIVGAAFLTLLYEVMAAAVPLIAWALSQRLTTTF